MFFLKFVPKEKRIAWAPSFGMDHIAPYNCRRFARDINEYKYLSVREKSGVDIIKNLTGRDAVQLSDPVLMLTPEQWRRLYKNRITAENFYKEYVFFYFLRNPSTYVLDYLDLCLEKGKTIVAFASNYECLKKRNNIVFREEVRGTIWRFLTELRKFVQIHIMLWHFHCCFISRCIYSAEIIFIHLTSLNELHQL